MFNDRYLSYGTCLLLALMGAQGLLAQNLLPRERVLINDDWKFFRYAENVKSDSLIYDERPVVEQRTDDIVADAKPEQAVFRGTTKFVLKSWILPSANPFIKEPASRYTRPAGDPGSDFPFVRQDFDDRQWTKVQLPHDWAIRAPFYREEGAIVGGGMGRLPVHGVAWYRKKLDIPVSDRGKSLYLEIDGAMSYAMVWLNGRLVGGWPHGYTSFRMDLTPYVKYGKENQLAIRLDNPTHSSRWYPGAGLYRNVWLLKTNPVQVAQWGATVRTLNASPAAAALSLDLTLLNRTRETQQVTAITEIYTVDALFAKKTKVGAFPSQNIQLPGNEPYVVHCKTQLIKPLLWGPPPSQEPNLYIASTQLWVKGKMVDMYETSFGIREVVFDGQKGLLVNGEPVRIQGVNQHHDLGALGAAFNRRAAERQLEMLRELGCNAIRLAHNPPAPELLDLTDRMGFLVFDEIFDNWERGKNPLDFHLIFPEWHEADIRSWVRRDRSHPSVIAWSFGNEVGEQYTADAGAKLAMRLSGIVKEEDSSRPTTASMNYAKPDMPFPLSMDVLSLNYQGEGIRDAPAYAHLKGIRTSPLYPAFHDKFPEKLIVSSETSSALSTRGTYIFPVTSEISAPVSDSTGGDPLGRKVSAYELYTAQFGASPDKVFASQDKHPYVGGEFVWSGWDYLGEPTPYYAARSSYSGIIDLAGFKKDRFFLYQSRWRPDLKFAHILPHWSWPGREGLVTPVHVFSSADEAELFLNGKSLGRKTRGAFDYRFRWDDVKYMPGELKVLTYKKGVLWAVDSVRTVGLAHKIKLTVDRSAIVADGHDLAFITAEILDENGWKVPEANQLLTFSVEGAGNLLATDNGDPADMVSFSSDKRNAYSGLALGIVQSRSGRRGKIIIHVSGRGLQGAELVLESK